MTRARNLANLGNKNALTADVGLFNIGIGSTQPTSYKLEVVGGNAYVGGVKRETINFVCRPHRLS